MGYIRTFGGQTVQSSDTSYAAYDLTFGSIELFWPTQFQDSSNVVYDYMNITSGGIIGRTITLPPATEISVGVSFKFNNVGPQAINILNNTGGVIVTVNSGQVWELYLTDNTTPAGVWSFIPAGAGVSGVVSFTSVQPASGFTVNQNATTGAIVQTFALNDDLLALENLAGTGYATRTANNTWATRTFANGANIVLTNPAGIAGNTTIALATAVAGLTSLTVGTINLSANIIAGTQLNQNILVSPSGTGELQSTNNMNIQSGNQIKFYNAGNTFYAGIRGGNAAANTTYTLPLVYPTTDNQVLGSSVAGVMSWLNAVTSPGATTVNAIAKYLNVTGQLANSGVLIDNANNITGAVSDIIQNIGIGTIAAIAGSGTNTISAQNAGGSIIFIPNGAGEVVSRGPLTLAPVAAVPQGVFFDDGAAANFVGLQAQVAAMAASTTYTLPNAGPPNLGQFLTSTIPAANASTMSWVNPAVVQTVRTVSNVAQNSVATVVKIIPYDNTIPQIGAGTEALTVTITPRTAGNLVIEFYCSVYSVSTGGAGFYSLFTLFQNPNANAIAATVRYITATSARAADPIYLKYILSPAVPNVAVTFSLRYGMSVASDVYLLTGNGDGAAVTLGGTPSMSLTVTELAP